MNKRIYQTIIASLALLAFVPGVQAAMMPSADFTFAPTPIVPGSFSLSGDLRDEGNDVLWFQFTLGSAADVSLNTLGSQQPEPNTDELDTVLALYDNAGTKVGDNDDCGTGILTSCLSFTGLAAGTYLAGVGEFDTEFGAMWELITGVQSSGRVTLNLDVAGVGAVPVPAAIWLFGSALVGFVGMSRRTTVKS